MSPKYKALGNGTLDNEVTFLRPTQNLPDTVTMDNPARDVMTDLTKVTTMTVNPCANIDQVGERMVSSEVHLLLVTNQFLDVIGIITSNDLSGSKALKYIKETGGNREDIMVRDLMTPQHKIEVLDLEDVKKSKVGDLVETLKHMGRRHALVIGRDEKGSQIICGLLSTAQIGKQLGMEISTADVASSIADLASSKE